jgi:hypothetical protein
MQLSQVGRGYASADPMVIVCICTWQRVATTAGYSTDGGDTWTQFGAVPTGVAGTHYNGAIAASSASNFVWVPFINAPRIYYTTNTGSTWTAATVTGVPTSGDTGWSNTFNNFVNRQNVCADRVTTNTFYAYNIGAVRDNSFAGIYKSSDSGANWSRVKAGLIGAYARDSFNGTRCNAIRPCGRRPGPAPPPWLSQAFGFSRKFSGHRRWDLTHHNAKFGLSSGGPMDFS